MINFLTIFFMFFLCGLSDLVHSKDKAPLPVTWNEDLKELLYDNDIINDGSKIMKMTSPYRALDAAIVPITISFNID